MRDWFRRLLRRTTSHTPPIANQPLLDIEQQTAKEVVTAMQERIRARIKEWKISQAAVANSRNPRSKRRRGVLAPIFIEPSRIFTPAEPFPGVVPRDVPLMATDSDIVSLTSYANCSTPTPYINGSPFDPLLDEGLIFPGFAYLAQLSQRTEYRRISETLAEEMTRKWIRFTAPGNDSDKTEKLAKLDEAFKHFDIKGIFYRCALLDGLYGRVHIFPIFNFDKSEGDLSSELMIDPRKIPKGSLKGFKIVEPTWTYPAQYNSTNPLDPDYYNPLMWYVQGRRVHRSRLLTFKGRDVPDMLKPAYSFAGISLTQMAIPYVNNWLRTRQSITDLVNSFSIMVLMTNLSSVLNGGGSDDMDSRSELFNNYRDNSGLFVVDKELEDVKNISAPLGGLDKLLAQAEEQMASVSQEPLVKLLGITPSGLNASSDGEIRVWYDKVNAHQEHLFRRPLTITSHIIQCSVFGEIDPDIDITFEPLWQLDDAAKATIRKTNQETASGMISDGVIDAEEERTRVAQEDGTLYPNLDLNKTIDPPGQEAPNQEDGDDTDPDPEEDGEDGGSAPKDGGTGGGPPDAAKSSGKAQDASPHQFQGRLGQIRENAELLGAIMAIDADWEESKHKRDHGKFAKVSGGSAAHEKSDAMFAKLHPDNIKNENNKKHNAKALAQVAAAHVSSDPVTALSNVKFNKGHLAMQKAISQAIQEHKEKAKPGSAHSEKPPEQKPPEQKPPEQKPPEQKPPEQKPPEQKPPEQKPPEQKPPEQKPPEQKPQQPTLAMPPINSYISSKTKIIAEGIKSNINNILPENKKAVIELVDSIHKALSKEGGDVGSIVEDLNKIKPIASPNGFAQTKANEYLNSIKSDYGASSVSPQQSAVSPQQAKNTAEIKTFPAIKESIKRTLIDSKGQEVTARLKINTDQIPHDGFAKVTAAFDGDHDHDPTGNAGPANSYAVGLAIQEYGYKSGESLLTNDEKDAISAYQGSYYHTINGALLNPPPTGKTKINIDKIESACRKGKCPADIPVWRGLNCSLEQLTGISTADQAIGHCFEHKNFASVSRQFETSSHFSHGKIMLRFTLPAGADCHVMQSQIEKEMVLPKGAIFKIKKIQKNVMGHKHVVHVVYCGHQEQKEA